MCVPACSPAHWSVMANERLVALYGCVIDDSYGANGSGSHAGLLVMERMYRDLHALLKTDADWSTRSIPPLPPVALFRRPPHFRGHSFHTVLEVIHVKS